ncbi:hypothetical protein [Dactylosporangium sp. NPDC049140]|uniref:hypothetical protein n=1 Tax=Dactylosporangium sp. NPDC049140 TaxID=3155647 RepID=UPI0033E18937
MARRAAAAPVPTLLKDMSGRRRRRAVAAAAALEALWDEDPASRARIWRDIWYRDDYDPAAAAGFLLGGEPARLLAGLSLTELVALAERHPGPLRALLHSAGPGPAGPTERVLLLLLAGRADRLAGEEPSPALDTLLRPWPPVLREACDRALATLPPGPLREELCQRCMDTDADPAAVDAVIRGGFRPADPDEAAFFLVATRQWSRFTEIDPQGRQLYAYSLATGFARPARARRAVDTLLRLNGHAPEAARTAAARALHDAKAQAREYLCTLALQGDPDATRIVAAAGHTPKPGRALPAFLFLTGQWERYDAADPGGSRLRRHAEGLPAWDPGRDRLCAAAARAGRPSPCAPTAPWPEPAERVQPA